MPSVRPMLESIAVSCGKTPEFEIWQVARAATASPSYFEPLSIENARLKTAKTMILSDSGINNSAQNAMCEVNMHLQ